MHFPVGGSTESASTRNTTCSPQLRLLRFPGSILRFLVPLSFTPLPCKSTSRGTFIQSNVVVSPLFILAIFFTVITRVPSSFLLSDFWRNKTFRTILSYLCLCCSVKTSWQRRMFSDLVLMDLGRVSLKLANSYAIGRSRCLPELPVPQLKADPTWVV